jgi:hypothetical protein
MKIAAVLMIVLALVIGILPQFTTCAADGRHLTLADGRHVPMKCSWTAQAEIALAVPLGATGLLLAFTKRRESQRMLSILGIFLGAMVILLPTALIGVCGNPDMICNAIMKPSLILSGSLVAGLSLVGTVQSWIKKEDTTWAYSG